MAPAFGAGRGPSVTAFTDGAVATTGWVALAIMAGLVEGPSPAAGGADPADDLLSLKAGIVWMIMAGLPERAAAVTGASDGLPPFAAFALALGGMAPAFEAGRAPPVATFIEGAMATSVVLAIVVDKTSFDALSRIACCLSSSLARIVTMSPGIGLLGCVHRQQKRRRNVQRLDLERLAEPDQARHARLHVLANHGLLLGLRTLLVTAELPECRIVCR
jgi:hypothetical protein